MLPAPPYLLFDDARANGAPARLYADPLELIVASRVDDVRPALERVRAALAAGHHVAGFVTYEAGAAFEPSVPLPDGGDATPLAWFGVFDRFTTVDAAALLPDPAGAWAGPPRPSVSRAEYEARFEAVQALIAAGDLYQANLTLRADVAVAGDPAALYARLRGSARAGWGAMADTGEAALLSLSPELFFALADGALTCRPMKGTAARDPDAARDRASAQALADDPKQRAENLMIVDLMRNDLSRIAAAGSVAVPALFEVEHYPSLHQMTSTVTATLAPGRDAIDVLAALFPCGSITGAPKVRAMQALAGIERAPRGVYTGAIGSLDPVGDAQFNVAIRTLLIERDAGKATIGLGGGIVADSRADEEWAEAIAKGAFVARDMSRIDLIETMAFDPEEGMPLLERHLARMKASADAFGFAFNRHDARNELQAATFRLRAPARVRLVLASGGAVAIEVSPAPAPLERIVAALAPRPVAAADFRLRHKTSDRAFYDRARGDHAEVVLLDADGFVTEGSYTSVFVERDGVLVTPPLARGLLPGVLRADLLATGRAAEGDLCATDLTGGFLLGNALRGLIPATLA